MAMGAVSAFVGAFLFDSTWIGIRFRHDGRRADGGPVRGGGARLCGEPGRRRTGLTILGLGLSGVIGAPFCGRAPAADAEPSDSRCSRICRSWEAPSFSQDIFVYLSLLLGRRGRMVPDADARGPAAAFHRREPRLGAFARPAGAERCASWRWSSAVSARDSRAPISRLVYYTFLGAEHDGRARLDRRGASSSSPPGAAGLGARRRLYLRRRDGAATACTSGAIRAALAIPLCRAISRDDHRSG